MSSPTKSAAAAAPEILSGLSTVANRYDAVLCDVWGVIHNGVDSFAEACGALQRFQEERGPVVLISNSPRPSDDVIAQLHALLVPDAAWSSFVTSGDVTRKLLAERAPSAAWAIGPDRDRTLYEGLNLTFAGPDKADFISCTGLINDEVETPKDYIETLSLAAERNLVMICANPDRVVQRGERLIYCGGALAALYAELGGEVLMAGKPFAPIYEQARAEADRLVGRPLDPARILAIGDGMFTDILGANRQGLDCLIVTDGIHAAEAADDEGRLDPARLAAILAKEQLHAAYALAALVW
jgi:HAD superfamily hydrolase (TIGR01459 family)